MSREQPDRESFMNMDRRSFLKLAGLGSLAIPAGSADASIWDAFFQKNFREMNRDDVSAMLERLERRYLEESGYSLTVKATPPLPGVKFGYGLDLSRCVGCRRCVYACVKENNQSRDPQIHWISVLRFPKDEKGVSDLERADLYYHAEEVPEEGYFYMPVACQHCEDPPCVKSCPAKATWTEPDGIVVIDYDWCVGCRFCMAACPYGARRFNWGRPDLPADSLNPDTHYLGNRPRPIGVVEKCSFCIQRVREEPGRYPACVEICPVGARKFGNLLDPDSEIRYCIDNKRVFRLKEDLNTNPKFFYFFAT
ncbi:4Fe-4S dicluster domain-containing protein [bacterium]|nr:4Fe-4S dicluster domain-containing protein [bacterium]